MYHIMIEEDEHTATNNTTDINIIDIRPDPECLICLDKASLEGDVYIMECCKNPLHIKCLVLWYLSHANTSRCFICNQQNSFCKDILDIEIKFNTIEEPDLSQNTIIIHQTSTIVPAEISTNHPNLIPFHHRAHHYVYYFIDNYRKACCCIIITLFAIATTALTIAIVVQFS